MHIAAFPKCFLDAICVDRTMDVFQWIDMADALKVEGLELYEGFFASLDRGYLESIGDALARGNHAMPMLCVSADFTHPDPISRSRAVEHQLRMMETARFLGGRGTACRILTGQRYPGLSLQEGLDRVAECYDRILPVAAELDIVLALENHYKDGYWTWPEFAQKMAVFLKVLASVPESPHFGVQYDPSNAFVAGDDPIELLDAVLPRVVTMHASDRFLAEGATLEDVKAADGSIGYLDALQHGVTGQGLNDYDAIFSRLAQAGFSGWVSIEDGMHGMDEMRRSVDFLHAMRNKHFA
ncbi:MAG: sugar phosphate isomerase/epimerase [Caldilineaceae bacterium SB0665_bin_21]|nr:sugar phosphate isomerase/epimerase [Caldilineaceae bacterium SB0665_bin_21]MYA04793.1 sugar phosphate isomerase/epimerase [Caldilineaceae bacterium SB0664_bin_22]MYC64234.1 sugar phosphate isomerase/epimerase [Caldilineaceae bacterium SB0661_bin_34]